MDHQLAEFETRRISIYERDPRYENRLGRSARRRQWRTWGCSSTSVPDHGDSWTSNHTGETTILLRGPIKYYLIRSKFVHSQIHLSFPQKYLSCARGTPAPSSPTAPSAPHGSYPERRSIVRKVADVPDPGLLEPGNVRSGETHSK